MRAVSEVSTDSETALSGDASKIWEEEGEVVADLKYRETGFSIFAVEAARKTPCFDGFWTLEEATEVFCFTSVRFMLWHSDGRRWTKLGFQ
jgi:hypothetical protein